MIPNTDHLVNNQSSTVIDAHQPIQMTPILPLSNQKRTLAEGSIASQSCELTRGPGASCANVWRDTGTTPFYSPAEHLWADRLLENLKRSNILTWNSSVKRLKRCWKQLLCSQRRYKKSLYSFDDAGPWQLLTLTCYTSRRTHSIFGCKFWGLRTQVSSYEGIDLTSNVCRPTNGCINKKYFL